GYILPSTREYVDGYGSYKAKVAVEGMPKDANLGYSSFFPDAMSPQEVIDAINEAYGNRTPLPDSDGVSVGFAANGMEIIIFTGREGKIISAFPAGQDEASNSR
ncbi:MAG: EndoU domain-containing protein, partial [Fretibacterium sp.]|nr:EndoU domain-containing protein [Fretibacterium sp.]